MKISITHHADGRSFRRTTEHNVTMQQAIAVYDPFLFGITTPCWYRRTQAVFDYLQIPKEAL